MTATTLRNQAMNSETRLASKTITSTRDLAAVAGDVSYTGVGFTPTSIICFTFKSGAALPTSWGVSDSTKTGHNMSKANDSNYYLDVNSSQLIASDTASATYQSALVKSYDADGFTLTWTKNNSPTGTLTMIFLCFR